MNLAGAREFLTQLSERVPAPVAHRHHIALENGRFLVILFDKDTWYSFDLDEEDCTKAPDVLAQAVALAFDAVRS